MLLHVKVGSEPEADTLVLTPELLEKLKDRLARSHGVYLRVWFYPLVLNGFLFFCLPRIFQFVKVKTFELVHEGERLFVRIPIRQLGIFEQKLIGPKTDIVSKPVGFLGL